MPSLPPKRDQLIPATSLEPGALINLGVHSHFGGRPLMAAMFRNILEYFRGHKDVWFAQHHEVAKWIVEQKIEDTSYAKRFGM